MNRRRACRGIAVLLAAVAAVPVGTVAAASAPLPPTSGRAGEPWPGAAGGLRRAWPGDTPGGRILPAVSTAMGMPATGHSLPGVPEGVHTPAGSGPVGFGRVGPEPDRSGPGGAGSGGAGVAGGRAAAGCGGRGRPYRWKAGRWSRPKADGKRPAAGCRAVRALRKKHGAEPAGGTGGTGGTGGAATGAGTRERAERGTPGARPLRGCPARSYRVACVDLAHQRTWVQQRGRILFGPVPMRSGGVRHPTRTGWFKIFWRHRHHWSTLYDSPMPYAQFFSGGQAFHAVRGSIRTVGGSMGCVNLRLADARGLWKVLRKGDRVYVWGRRPRPRR
ncbi:L,D-transpeptidase [Streptomyces sp. NPDC021080]|uniref:L,D-transpeptidase n=1 Tax=Streptomyces sp. NPDC021080 TaxID=3365110 RepID=UPI0037ADFF47